MTSLFHLMLIFSLLGITDSPCVDTVTIMPIGDSITEGYGGNGCYRKNLYYGLQDQGIDVAYTGPYISLGGRDEDWGGEYAAKRGYKASDLKKHIKDWIEDYRPSVITLMIGTNVVHYKSLENSVWETEDLLNYIYEIDPSISVIVLGIPPIAGHVETVRLYNYRLSQRIEDLNRSISKESWKRFYYLRGASWMKVKDLRDGIHPKYQSCEELGKRLAPDMKRAIEEIQFYESFD